MKKYKNISDTEQLLIGVGVVEPGDTVETDVVVDNENFILIENEK